MGFNDWMAHVSRKNKMENVHLPKISLLVHIDDEI